MAVPTDAKHPSGSGDDARVGPVAIRLRRWALALAAWSLFVWATRIDNIVGDDALTAAGKVGRVALAASFVLLAVAVVVRWWRPSPRRSDRVLVALAVWTGAVWLVRGVGIALGDHEVAFIVVHLVLAAVSIGLAVRVLMLHRSPAILSGDLSS